MILKIDHEKKGGVDIVALVGILNAETTEQFGDMLHSLSNLEIPNIIIDGLALVYISSAGIGNFIEVIKTIREKEGDIRFCNLNDKVKRVFELLDMEDFFKFYSNRDEAMVSYTP